MSGDSAEWDETKNVLVVGEDVIRITSIASAPTTLTVTRSTTNTIGTTNARTYDNNRSELTRGDSVFRGLRYDDADLADIIFDILNSSGIDDSFYNEVEIRSTLDGWVGSQNISCLFTEPMPVVDVLDNICQTFLIDIYTSPDNQIKVSATSPWDTTDVTFKEGREITFGKGSIDVSEGLRYSRALLTYGLKNQTDDSTYKSNTFKFNSEFEGENYYNEEKLFTFDKSNILSIDTRSKEIASNSVTRFINRWAFKPLIADLEINKAAYDQINLGDTVFIEHSLVQNGSGAVDTTKRYQVTKLKPLKNTFYQMKALSFVPFAGGSESFTYDPVTGEITVTGPIDVTNDKDINLYEVAGSPPPSAQLTEYTFVIDSSNIGVAVGKGRDYIASIIDGEGWVSSGIVFNIVCKGGIYLTSSGGNGGAGSLSGGASREASKGGNGGTVIYLYKSHTVNIYLSGNRTVQGNNFDCDGYLYAPGGGGGGGSKVSNPTPTGAGAGGAGYPTGTGGLRGDPTNPSGATPATLLLGGDGEVGFTTGGDGGDSGDDGIKGEDSLPNVGGDAGLAGKALVKNSGTVNLFGSGRFIQGGGDAADSVTP